jgi:hypothetical protein
MAIHLTDRYNKRQQIDVKPQDLARRKLAHSTYPAWIER